MSSARNTRALLSLLAVSFTLTSRPTGAADAPVAPEKFRAWATQVAKSTGLRLCRGGVARFSPQQPAASFAVFRQEYDGDIYYALVVAWGSQRRAFRSQHTTPDRFDCPQAAVWENTRVIKLGPWGQGMRRLAQLAVVDDKVAVVQEEEEGTDYTHLVDWEAPVASGRDTEVGAKRNASLFLLIDPKSPGRAQLPKPRTWVTFQKTPHGGAADSSLSVRTELVAKSLRVEMEATDDVLRPLPDVKASDAAFLKADHFELWFCESGASRRCNKQETRQLGVARTAGGQLHARWLHPKGNTEKLPSVVAVAGKGAVVVTMPLSWIRNDETPDGALDGELTVAYSDADLEGKGQEAVVATSEVKWGVGYTFGQFIRHPGGTRFPTWDGEGFPADEAFLKALPRF